MTWASDVSIWDANATRRVLVVDDDEAMARMIRLTLVSEGYAVSTAADGILGLEQLDMGGIDVVVLDLQMPNMDGRQMYAEMARKGMDVPVVILSAYGADAAREELGAAAAVRKPFDTTVLLDIIHRLIAR